MIPYALTGLLGMGTVNKESHTKDANLFKAIMPGTDSSDAVLLDLFGAGRTITISGTFVTGDTNYPMIKQAIQALEALLNGAQTSRTFTSGKSEEIYNVLVDSVSWNSEEGAPDKLTYDLTLLEGDV